jgi:hypothetical protein
LSDDKLGQKLLNSLSGRHGTLMKVRSFYAVCCYRRTETVFSQTTSCLYFSNYTAGSMLQQRIINQGFQTCCLSVHFIQPSHHVIAITVCGLAWCLSPNVSLLALSTAILMWHQDRRMSPEQWWNGADRGKPKYSEKKPLSVLVCPPKFPSELALEQIVQCQKDF